MQVTGQGTTPRILKVGISEAQPTREVAEVFNKLVQRLDLQVRYITSDFSNANALLQNGTINISAHGVSYQNKTAPRTICTASDPYLNVLRGFCVNGTSPYAQRKKLDDSARVAVVQNSTACEDLQNNYPALYQNRTVVTSFKDARALLESGQVDAVARGYLGFRFNAEDEKNLPIIDVHPMRQHDPNAEALVFWVHNDLGDTITALNDIIREYDGNIYRNRMRQPQS